MKMRVDLLPCRVERDVVVPSFLVEQDYPWLQRLIERAELSEGMRAADIEDHLLAPLPLPAPPAKQRLAVHQLVSMIDTAVDAAVKPREARERLFTTAARMGAAPEVVVAKVAADLGVSEQQLLSALFADRPEERVVTGVEPPTSPAALSARANLWLAQAWISRAVSVQLDVKGTSRPLVLATKTKGLLCSIHGSPDGSAAVLDLSGPLSLFKRTRLYGRALASLLPTLAWCDRWIVDAECMANNGKQVTFRLSTGAPILPSSPPPVRYDSKVEKRLAADFEKLRTSSSPPPFMLVREPRPIATRDGLLFPDFALEPVNGGAPFFIEIVGFWTPAYVDEKLARYRRARIDNLLLCVDADLGCTDDALPAQARVLRYKKRIDVAQVLRIVADADADAAGLPSLSAQHVATSTR